MAVAVRVQLGAALSQQKVVVPDDAALRSLMARAARAALRHDRVHEAELSVTLLDDDEISGMNRDFLDHAGPTDVISFALYDAGEAPVGDVYIGYEQACRQAAAVRIPLSEELVRLTVHGVLHVLGHDHHPDEQRFDSSMWVAQEQIVAKVISQ